MKSEVQYESLKYLIRNKDKFVHEADRKILENIKSQMVSKY